MWLALEFFINKAEYLPIWICILLSLSTLVTKGLVKFSRTLGFQSLVINIIYHQWFTGMIIIWYSQKDFLVVEECQLEDLFFFRRLANKYIWKQTHKTWIAMTVTSWTAASFSKYSSLSSYPSWPLKITKHHDLWKQLDRVKIGI